MSHTLMMEAEARFPYRTVNGIDHKAWAKRILFREERRDASLLPVQVTFAKQAMGLEPLPNSKDY